MIGIAGGSGSGKTTFANKILNHIGDKHLTLISMDSYYLPKLPKDLVTKSGSPNYDHPHAFDWELLNKHFEQLKSQQSIDVPLYDFTSNSRIQETKRVNPKKIILFEGIFTLFDLKIREMLDIKCFLHVEADIRFTRRLHRDVNERGRSLESVIDQYYKSVRPMYQKYLDPQKQYADFTIGEETDVAATILAAKIKELLNES